MSKIISRGWDYLVVGGGIVGLTVAREMRKRYPAASIAVLEKESELGRHASGRNSGVLHSGIYYDSSTLKARVCAEGARRMKQFASENGINCQHTGKVIVATGPQDLAVIERLYENAQKNGIRAELLDEEGVRRIEPHAGVYRQGIHCMDTAVIDIKAVLLKLQELLVADGIEIIFHAPVTSVDVATRTVITPVGEFNYGYLFNCAGASADRVAKHYGLGLDYTLVPFKGIYFKLRPERADLVHANIYPVPDINQPFLGVHLTRVASGAVYAGPTAIPALGRENYGILQGARFTESLRVGFEITKMYLADQQNFRELVHTELGKYRKRNFFAAVQKLMPELTYNDLVSCDKVGIRPQLVNVREKRLEMDYVIEKSSDSLHVLNAISPAFTSSLAFAEWIVDQSLTD
ncbi:MAG: L-2-hydroxyglutarate oxidase [Chlorobium sp.]|jgi:L-2-hydroxyglutarate oxidase LhgO|nr:L-2-hydroxyglutarate oxidase [Chlorobium sp.]